MHRSDRIVGRDRELVELGRAAAAAHSGFGSLILLSGEAGVGKTRLAEESLSQSGLLVLHGTARHQAAVPYGPIVEALRSSLHSSGERIPDWGPLTDHLALLIPELGGPPPSTERSTITEAIQDAFVSIARSRPTVLFLDDLHWADDATLDLIPTLAGRIAGERMLLLGSYRSEEIPRGHPLRAMRTDLRRANLLQEIVVARLDPDATAVLVSYILEKAPSQDLAEMVHDRTQGVPFYIEELTAALIDNGRLDDGPMGVTLRSGEDVPVPDTVRDAVLLRIDRLSGEARDALEIVAVAGESFELDLVADLTAGPETLEEPLAHGIVVESSPGRGRFRHALTREAIYADISWSRRRKLHRQLAEWMERAGEPALVVAEHWLAGRDLERARHTLLKAVEASCVVHAYGDALHAGRRAMEIWPEDDDEIRVAVLDRLGLCAQLTGDLAETIRHWREVADEYRATGEVRALADIERRLAGTYELQGAIERAIAAHQAAAVAYAACEHFAEAAGERLVAASQLQSAGSHRAALPLVAQASIEADCAGRTDLRARALGLEGVIRAKLGEFDAGIKLVHEGLRIALEGDLATTAPELYVRLAAVSENASDYSGALDAYSTALGLCQAQGFSGLAMTCLSCLAYILRQRGEWDRSVELCREVLDHRQASAGTKVVAAGMLGSIYVCRGDMRRARSILLECSAQATRLSLHTMMMESAWWLACIDAFSGRHDTATERSRFVLASWEQSDDHHYAIPLLRGAASYFSSRGNLSDTQEVARALSTISTTGTGEAIAALGHALGEIALLTGETGQALVQFGQAIDLLNDLQLPYDRAMTQFRAGVTLLAAGRREAGIEHLIDVYRTARKLRARPLAEQAARELDAVGEWVERRLGRQAVQHLAQGGLSRRELEVIRLITEGRTNREIGHQLFLSPRTVDMHVRNILTKLDCRSRTEAARRAAELGLLEQTVTSI